MVIIRIHKGKPMISEEILEWRAKNMLLKMIMELDLKRGESASFIKDIDKKNSLHHPNGDKYIICHKDDVQKKLKDNFIFIDRNA